MTDLRSLLVNQPARPECSTMRNDRRKCLLAACPTWQSLPAGLKRSASQKGLTHPATQFCSPRYRPVMSYPYPSCRRCIVTPVSTPVFFFKRSASGMLNAGRLVTRGKTASQSLPLSPCAEHSPSLLQHARKTAVGTGHYAVHYAVAGRFCARA